MNDGERMQREVEKLEAEVERLRSCTMTTHTEVADMYRERAETAEANLARIERWLDQKNQHETALNNIIQRLREENAGLREDVSVLLTNLHAALQDSDRA